jgi:hypothetical protein
MTGNHAILGEFTPPVLKTTKLRKEAEKNTMTWDEKLTAFKKKTIKKATHGSMPILCFE